MTRSSLSRAAVAIILCVALATGAARAADPAAGLAFRTSLTVAEAQELVHGR